MLYFVLLLLVSFKVNGQKATVPKLDLTESLTPQEVIVIDIQSLIAQKLRFIEDSVMNILSVGSFPEIFGIRPTQLSSCGCEFGTSPVYWGDKVGMYCRVNSGTIHSTGGCGKNCFSPKGLSMLLMCPENWEADCAKGCQPPTELRFEERGNFFMEQVQLIATKGQEYIMTDRDYMETCACRGARMTHITYGTEVGFDCVVDEQPQTGCKEAFRNQVVFEDDTYQKSYQRCTNREEERILTFCSDGFHPTCRGCVSWLTERGTLEERYDWAIKFLTWYVRETHKYLTIEPATSQVTECGCTTPFQRVEYGNQIGYSCTANREAIKPQCNVRHTMCQNENKETILHFCPAGFKPNCSQGCSYWWSEEKTEL